MTVTPPDERHGVGILMVADFLRASGYDVHHLGIDVPVDDLALFLEIVPADVVCVSVTRDDLDPSVLTAVVDAVGGSDGTLAVLGGTGVSAELAGDLGALHVAELDALAPALEATLRT